MYNARDNVDGNFFKLKTLFEDVVYLCLKSTVDCKSIYKKLHKSDYNDCKYIIVIFIEAGFRVVPS